MSDTDTDDKANTDDKAKQWVVDVTMVTFMNAMNWYPHFTEAEIDAYNDAVERLGASIGFTDLNDRGSNLVDTEGEPL